MRKESVARVVSLSEDRRSVRYNVEVLGMLKTKV